MKETIAPQRHHAGNVVGPGIHNHSKPPAVGCTNPNIPKALTPQSLAELKRVLQLQKLGNMCMVALIALVLGATMLMLFPASVVLAMESITDTENTASLTGAVMVIGVVAALSIIAIKSVDTCNAIIQKNRELSRLCQPVDDYHLQAMIQIWKALPETAPLLRSIKQQKRRPTYHENRLMVDYKKDADSRLDTLNIMKAEDGIEGIDAILRQIDAMDDELVPVLTDVVEIFEGDCLGCQEAEVYWLHEAYTEDTQRLPS